MIKKDIDAFINQLIVKITRKRKKRGWTYENMASELNISPAAYYKIENGVTKLSLKRLLQICKILNIDLKELLELQTQSAVEQKSITGLTNKLTQHIYNDNKELIERYINRLEKEIENLKAKTKK